MDSLSTPCALQRNAPDDDLSPAIRSIFVALIVSWNGVSEDEAQVIMRCLDRLEVIEARYGRPFAEAMARRVVNILRHCH